MASTLTWKLGKGELHTDGLPYYVQGGIWTICRTFHSGVCKYTLWERNQMVETFDSRQPAMALAEEMERRRA